MTRIWYGYGKCVVSVTGNRPTCKDRTKKNQALAIKKLQALNENQTEIQRPQTVQRKVIRATEKGKHEKKTDEKENTAKSESTIGSRNKLVPTYNINLTSKATQVRNQRYGI
ncbi:hypothetical protein CHS0354_022410 [Potamilus streckersoni]|uniref:Uncharacterized protein n=1 Tax=Potamilus streckersoni TaxID=2493646 RepID=A0AAE0SX47_9BIVA|nr:hypothetical protein CHS0354_022410 [Potamilus streckersoni]